MESKNKGVWLIVVAVVALGCCCLLTCSTAVASLLASRSVDRFWDRWSTSDGNGVLKGNLQRERVTRIFDVGSAPALRIDNFAGGVTVHGEEVAQVQVVATKMARFQSDLARIEIEMTERDGGLEIKTRYPAGAKNASVSFDIVVPAGTYLDADLAAGAVVVEGTTGGLQARTAAGAIVLMEVSGGIDAQTAAGVVSARGASGPVSLASAAGVIEYQGTPQGDCSFEAAAGSISLDLPADPDLTIDLQTTIGSVEAACGVVGTGTGRKLQGVIGAGSQGTIVARVTVGDIDMVCR